MHLLLIVSGARDFVSPQIYIYYIFQVWPNDVPLNCIARIVCVYIVVVVRAYVVDDRKFGRSNI